MDPKSLAHAPSLAPSDPRSQRVRWVALGLCGLLLAATWVSLGVGRSGDVGAREGVRGLLAWLGLADPLEPTQAWIVGLRWTRTLVTALVGASLAYAGALLQGVFRNDLAAPSILGTTAGASLGASIAILAAGGQGLEILNRLGPAPVLVQVCAFLGAAGVTWLVAILGRVGGRFSIPTLLLVGIAINAVVGGILAALQSFALADFEVARALFAWGFGHLDDKGTSEIAMVGAALVVGACVIPFVARELDMLEAGEEDAAALGVNLVRVKALALLAATLCAAASVAAVGQIAFVGLVVPHILRLLAGRSYRKLLPLCLLGGAAFLLSIDASQRALLGDMRLRPGVTLSLVGGPFFLFLLVKSRKRMTSW
ncbi:MAG: iron ABC transporter permease [Planctomycetes bacterium]|nr:iron ABC transporter permease [Planctomycetota bacterium]MCB9910820.1 iron ABC transporter permease [Planctomycetota bacterium]MCB9912248.1 iron ABC transporter permease [Planctomycetota bacterium]HPF12795.1 iron ABC transporter permease [Planctomycetota bacterium]